MKKKLLILITAMIIGVLALTSCGDDAPEGLSVVTTSNDYGVKFYCPEGWTVVSDSYNGDYKVYAAKLVGRSITSVTFVGAPMPEGELSAYLDESLGAFPEDIYSTLKVTKPLTKESFGNADEAYKCIYTYKYTDRDYSKGGYKEIDVTCLQYLIKDDGRFYIFTYTAEGAHDDEEGNYRKHLESAELSAKHFTFTGKHVDKPETEAGGDNFVPVSDKTLCGYELYLPEKYEVIGNTGDVEAKISDGAYLSLTRANDANIDFFSYLGVRKTELSRIVGEITDVRVASSIAYNGDSKVFETWGITVMPEVEEGLQLGNLRNVAVSYEYTYEYGGVTYRAYQLLGMTSRTGFVFTYIAPDAEYSEHLETIEEIIKRVDF